MKPETRYVVCTRNEDCDDLDPRKIYQVLPDGTAAEEGYLRIVDESGEDYLYPADYFMEIQLPWAVGEALKIAS
jgi:hypothetical protein